MYTFMLFSKKVYMSILLSTSDSRSNTLFQDKQDKQAQTIIQ